MKLQLHHRILPTDDRDVCTHNTYDEHFFISQEVKTSTTTAGSQIKFQESKSIQVTIKWKEDKQDHAAAAREPLELHQDPCSTVTR